MRISATIVLLTLVGLSCGCETKSDTGASEPKPVATVEQPALESIGEATMKADGTLVLQLRAESPGGGAGDALFEYPPDDPKYQETLEHIGGLKPGESKPVPPWPEADSKQEP
jgi:hypothetical protein